MSGTNKRIGGALGRGPIAWMAQNPVASNLLMLMLMGGGFLVGTKIKQEVFPEFDMDVVSVSVAYPGASPEEVEQGIVLAIEEAVRGVDGIKRVTGTANEGLGSVSVELLLATDPNKALADIKAEVDRIRTFPEEAERAVTRLMSSRQQVISLVIYGDLSESVLREYAEQTRAELIALEGITVVELDGERKPEVAVEVSTDTLRRHKLTLGAVAEQIRSTSLELPGGSVKTASGEVLLRTAERRDLAREFGDIVVVSGADGSQLLLDDIAHIRDDFEETDEAAYYNGKLAQRVNVYRVGDETPISVADAALEYMEELKLRLPDGVAVAPWNDQSQMFRERVDLLRRNALIGLVLVLIVLGLFLEVKLAFWVTLGIPISFLGALLIIPGMGVTINMISLFAFIVTLGIVVDDAIIVGENIYEMRQRGVPVAEAAIMGAKEVATPVVFAVTTTIVTFAPLLMVPGFLGKLFGVIPTVVISILLMSLIESLFVLPAHLSHDPGLPKRGLARYLALPFALVMAVPFYVFKFLQIPASRLLNWVNTKVYAPLCKIAIEYRYLTLAVGIASLIAVGGLVAGGRIAFTFMPAIESDRVTAVAVLPFGSAVEETRAVQAKLEAGVQKVLAEHGDGLMRGMYSQLGRLPEGGGPQGGAAGAGGGHLASVQVYLVPLGDRDMSAKRFTQAWRESVGEIPGMESLSFAFAIGRGAGSAVNVQLSHRSTDVLETAGADLAVQLATLDGAVDIDDGFSLGKPQLDFQLEDHAETLGLTTRDLGRQLRDAFYGAEALRQQRGRNELRVMVRLPKEERGSEHDVEELFLRTRDGGELSLASAATVNRGRAFTSIKRSDGRRVLNVTSDVRDDVPPGRIVGALTADVLPALIQRYPGLTFSLEGDQREQAESMEALQLGMKFSVGIIFALLAIVFRSYIQPIVVIVAIPFGLVGAVLGHMLMGFNLSVISMMGMLALMGVVVNDSLVLIDATNQFRQQGMSAKEAVWRAGVRRFRPILLTTLTTFFGLAPMIFETSVQARFLIPMAISLGFGVLFATFIILGIVPALYVIMEDLKLLVIGRQPADEEGPPGGGGGDAPDVAADPVQPEPATVLDPVEAPAAT